MAVTASGALTVKRARDAHGAALDQLTLRDDDDGERTILSMRTLPGRIAAVPSCGADQLVTPLFAPRLLWDANGGRIVVHAGGPYAIDVYEGERRVSSIRRNLLPRRVDADMARREAAAGWKISDCIASPDEVVRGAGYAESLPSIMALTPSGEV
jgi:hypothetical protein